MLEHFQLCRNISWPDIFFLEQKSLLRFNHNLECFLISFHSSLFILALKAGDIELNPESNKKSHSYLSCFHWNVNRLPTNNYCKVAALKTFNSVHKYKYDFLCVSETFLNS